MYEVVEYCFLKFLLDGMSEAITMAEFPAYVKMMMRKVKNQKSELVHEYEVNIKSYCSANIYGDFTFFRDLQTSQSWRLMKPIFLVMSLRINSRIFVHVCDKKLVYRYH